MTGDNRMRTMIAIAALTAVAGCGVPQDRAARAVDQFGGPPRSSSPTQTGFAVGRDAQRIYLVSDDHLVAVARHLRGRSPRDVLDALMAGPTPAERGRGISTALSANLSVNGVRVDNGVAVVDVSSTVVDGGRTDDVEAFGQIVLTLVAVPGVDAVRFTQGGQPLGVPRGDGSLDERPLTAADYQLLVSP